MSSPTREDPAIEALRGFAALMVVAVHYVRFVRADIGVLGFASTGVDLFFVLSGYVFAPYLLGKPLPVVPHLVRRFFRLYPLYLLALVTYAVLKLPDPAAWSQFGTHVLMLHTLHSPEVAFFYNPAFWSLPPEVEFYLLLPLLAWWMGARALRWIFVPALLLHLILAALATPGEGSTVRAIATVHLPGLLIEFCLGAWAFVLARQQGGTRRWLRLAAGILWLAMAWWVYGFQVAGGRGATAPGWISGNVGLAAAAGYALVVSAVAGTGQALRGWQWRLCVVAGELSYGVYLFHNAAAQIAERLAHVSGWTGVTVSLALTLLLAFALHHAVEAPARQFGRSLGERVRDRRPA